MNHASNIKAKARKSIQFNGIWRRLKAIARTARTARPKPNVIRFLCFVNANPNEKDTMASHIIASKNSTSIVSTDISIDEKAKNKNHPIGEARAEAHLVWKPSAR